MKRYADAYCQMLLFDADCRRLRRQMPAPLLFAAIIFHYAAMLERQPLLPHFRF